MNDSPIPTIAATTSRRFQRTSTTPSRTCTAPPKRANGHPAKKRNRKFPAKTSAEKKRCTACGARSKTSRPREHRR